MSRPSISTGGIQFNTRAKEASSTTSQRDDSAPMQIVVIGDFSGRGSRGEAGDIASRRAIEVDKDNYEDVFTRLKVRLSLPASEEPLAFTDVDDLHPDTLFNELSLFEKFRTLKRKLKNPDLFQQAADEILQWPALKSELASKRQADASPGSTTNEAPAADNFLDSLLARGAAATEKTASVDHLIRDIISPYIETKEDPRRPEFEAAVEAGISHAMRQIMHHGAFQELEANWREVYFLVRNLELNNTLKLFILDISRDELVDDLLNNSALEDCAIYKNLVDQYQVPGAQGFSLLQFNYYLEDDIDDLRIAAAMANLANTCDGVALGGVSEKLAHCADLSTQEDPADWNYSLDEHIAKAWEDIRCDPSAAHLALVAPRFLLRQPYGKKSSPVDSFAFEELGDKAEHDYFCWGNGASIITFLLAQAFLQSGWQFSAGQVNTVDDLPLFIYRDEDGDSAAKACAEIYMSDSVANKLAEAGILSLRSVKGQAAITVSNFRTMAKDGAKIFSQRNTA